MGDFLYKIFPCLRSGGDSEIAPSIGAKTSGKIVSPAGGEIDKSPIEQRSILTEIGGSHWAIRVVFAVLGAALIAAPLWQVLALGYSFLFLSISCIGAAIEVVLAISLFSCKKAKPAQKQETKVVNSLTQSSTAHKAEAFLDGPLSAKGLFGERGMTALKNEIRRVNGLPRNTTIRNAFNENVFNFIKQFDRFGILDDLTLGSMSLKGVVSLNNGQGVGYPEGKLTFQTMKFDTMRDAVACIAALAYISSECFVFHVDINRKISVCDIRSLAAMKLVSKELERIDMAVIGCFGAWQTDVFDDLPGGVSWICRSRNLKLGFAEKK